MNDTPPMKPDGDPTTLAEAIFDLTESAKTAEHYGVDAHDVSPAAIRIVLTETAALSAALARSEERVKELEAHHLRDEAMIVQRTAELKDAMKQVVEMTAAVDLSAKIFKQQLDGELVEPTTGTICHLANLKQLLGHGV